MVDLKEIGDEYQWWLGLQDLANGDARHIAETLRNPKIGITEKMREQLAVHLLAKRKRPRRRPSKLTASQLAELNSLLTYEISYLGAMRKNATEMANQLNVEPCEILQVAARWRQEHREAWAQGFNVSVHTIEKLMKDLRRKRRGRKSRI